MLKSRHRTGAAATTRRPKAHTLILAMAVATPALGPVGQAGAEDDVYHWINPEGGLFRDADNWDREAWPGSGATAVFDLDTSYGVELDADTFVQRLRVHAGDVTADPADHYFVPSGGDSGTALAIGQDGGDEATLRLVGASMRIFGADTRVGEAEDATGTFVVSGPDAIFESGGAVHVGDAGTGTMVVEDFASVSPTNYRPEIILGSTATGHGTLISRNLGWDEEWGRAIGGISADITVGAQGTGELRVEGGGSASFEVVGRDAGSVGNVLATGTDADGNPARISGGSGTVGLHGQGSLTVENGARLGTGAGPWPDAAFGVGGASGSEGAVTVRGQDTIWSTNGNVDIGFAHDDDVVHTGGSGHVIIEDGATVTSRGGPHPTTFWRVGAGLNSTGSLTLRDTDTSFIARAIRLGGHSTNLTGATGSLLIENGATANLSEAFMAINPDDTASATIRGPGAALAVDDELSSFEGGPAGLLVVGWSGTAELDISDAGYVESRVADVARAASGTGTVHIADPESTWAQGEALNLGVTGGDASVSVENSARVDVGETLQLGSEASLAVTTGGAVSVGSLEPEQDVHELDGDRIHVWDDGLVVGRGDIEVAKLRNAGRVAPGSLDEDDPAGTLNLTGEYQQETSGTLEITITDETHSQLAVEGEAELAGTLEVALSGDGEADLLGQAVDVLTAYAVTGEFDDVAAAERDDLYFDVAYASQAVTVTPGLIGDMNGDGIVDAADVAPFVLALTDPTAYEAQYGIDPNLAGDLNQDGTLDAADVAPFVARLVGESETASTVPEPGSAAIALSLALSLGMRRHRRAPRP